MAIVLIGKFEEQIEISDILSLENWLSPLLYKYHVEKKYMNI